MNIARFIFNLPSVSQSEYSIEPPAQPDFAESFLTFLVNTEKAIDKLERPDLLDENTAIQSAVKIVSELLQQKKYKSINIKIENFNTLWELKPNYRATTIQQLVSLLEQQFSAKITIVTTKAETIKKDFKHFYELLTSQQNFDF